MNSIFIMSSERSGSNLLRKMLGMHSQLSAPPPPHLWTHLTNVIKKYGPLTQEENLHQLISNAILMTQVPKSHLKWKFKIASQEVLGTIKSTNLSAVICALYQLYAEKDAKQGWVCKENNLFNHAFQIRDTDRTAKFIYLCRDGRDVACSIKKVPTHDQHIYFIAKEWKKEQEKCLQVYQELQSKNLALLVRYEDLIVEPKETLEKICNFIGLSYEECMLHFHESKSAVEEAKKTGFWKNLSKPVMSDNKGKFLEQLTNKEMNIFESVNSEILSILGYPVSNTGIKNKINLPQRIFYKFQNLLKKRYKKQKLYEEEGRLERKKMLNQIYDTPERPNSIAPKIEY